VSFRLSVRTGLAAGLVCLQAADLICTYLLLEGARRGDVYEANPLARSILRAGGWSGVALFKFSLTGVAVLASLLVARRRPAMAARLLGLLCAVMLGVNVYSGTLLASPGADAEERQVNEARERLDRQVAGIKGYCDVRRAICDAVLDGECDVAEASSRLAAAITTYGPQMQLPRTAGLPDPSQSAEVQAHLNVHLYDRAAARGLLDRLAKLGSPAWPRCVNRGGVSHRGHDSPE
jgi:hypothetical protein